MNDMYILITAGYRQGETESRWLALPIMEDALEEEFEKELQFYKIDDVNFPFDYELEESTTVLEVNKLCYQYDNLNDNVKKGLNELLPYFKNISDLIKRQDDIFLYENMNTMKEVAIAFTTMHGYDEKMNKEFAPYFEYCIDYEKLGYEMNLNGTFVLTGFGIYQISI